MVDPTEKRTVGRCATIGLMLIATLKEPIMYRLLFLFSLGCGTLGCQSFGHPKACAPGEPCYAGNAAPVTTVTAPAPKIEVQTPETIIVRAPAQKVIIEQPAASTYPGPGYGGAPPNNNYGAGPPNMPPGGVMPVAGGVFGVLEFGAVTLLAFRTPKPVLVGVTGACNALAGFVPGTA